MEGKILSEKEKIFRLLKKYISSTTIILFIILLAAAYLRFHKLTRQSFWGDELVTMADAYPGLRWHQFMESIKYIEGVHPPLFFIFERYFLSFFGYNEWNARAVSAFAGIACIYAIFLLGKEIKNEKLGLTAAALMCVNYFSIFYSQEARMYSFLCLFTSLSYFFFLRVCKNLKKRDAILFVVFTTCLIYTHYFGFLVIASQLVLAIFFLLQEKHNRKKLLAILFISELTIVVAYIPWIPRLNFTSNIQSFWIPPTTPKFLVDVFNEYFGYVPYINHSSTFLSWIVLVFLIIYFIAVIINIKAKGFKNFKANPLILSFIFVSISLVISIGIPYLRSIMVVPLLVSRYTIIVLPSIIIAFAYGIEAIPYKATRYMLLGLFLFLSIRQIVFVEKYYAVVLKPQIRELTAFVTSKGQNHTLVNENGVMDYYLRIYGFKGDFFSDDHGSEKIIDSILQRKSAKYQIDTFWLVSIYNKQPLTSEKQSDLDTAYMNIKDTVLFQAEAELYARTSKYSTKTIDYTYFDPKQTFNDGKPVVAIWSKDAISKPIAMPKGKYSIVVLSKGTPVANIYPHNNLFINDNKIGSFVSGQYYERHTFPFDQLQDTTITIKIDMDNDAATNGEDRNTFIRNIYILKTKD